jgi:hypothetical protein
LHGFILGPGAINTNADGDTMDIWVGWYNAGLDEAITLEWKVSAVDPGAGATADGSSSVIDVNGSANTLVADEVVITTKTTDHVWVRAVKFGRE